MQLYHWDAIYLKQCIYLYRLENGPAKQNKRVFALEIWEENVAIHENFIRNLSWNNKDKLDKSKNG